MKDEKGGELIHIHNASLLNKGRFYVIFLLIPSIAFVITIAMFLRKVPGQDAASTVNAEVSALRSEGKKKVLIENISIFVEIADNEILRKNGLSGRTFLGENSGMLFVFESSDIRPAFWMKDMKIPIDIIWINDNKITQIDKNVPPPVVDTPEGKLKLYLPNDSIDYVLEVRSGFSESYGIGEGNEVDLTKAL